MVNIVKKETEITKAEKIPETKVEEIKAPEVVKLQMTKETKIVAIPVVTKNIGNGFEGGYFKNGYDEKTGWDAAKKTVQLQFLKAQVVGKMVNTIACITVQRKTLL
ncbi:MAG: hypothetical protein IPP48_02410 [Chitinophagaceae bacterium]|nr:hypothetical protein [Chitinophagaceae bacterium]